MNINVASQNQGVIAWSGGATPVANDIDIRHHNNFGFTFRVVAALGANTVFKVTAAPPSDADPCVPGTYADVEEVLSCSAGFATPAPTSTLTIPAGTPVGSICTATLPCRPNAFLKLASVSGDTADVEVVAVLGGPR